jgi:hypothetical protein
MFNSILNAAYISIAAPELQKCRSWHTGDDVFIAAPDMDVAHSVLTDLLNSPIRLNKSKQIVGSLGGEWLRVSFNENVGRSYIARSVASLVSGNWVADTVLSREEYINTYLSYAWTFRNRTDVTTTGLCLQSSFRRRVPELARFATGLLTNTRSFNGSPVFTEAPQVSVCYAEFSRVKGRPDKNLPSLATQDYIDNHVDHRLLNTAGITPGELKGLMLEASYAKALESSDAITNVWEGVGSVRVHVSLKRIPRQYHKGVLSSIFPLTFIKSRLTRQQLIALLYAFGHEPKSDVMTQAWGSKSPLATTSGHVSWSVMRSCAGGMRENASMAFSYELRT